MVSFGWWWSRSGNTRNVQRFHLPGKKKVKLFHHA